MDGGIEHLGRKASGERVLLAGMVRSDDPGSAFRMRDRAVGKFRGADTEHTVKVLPGDPAEAEGGSPLASGEKPT